MNRPASAAAHEDSRDGPPHPRRGTGRIPEIDTLRGFALLGICLVNAPFIAGVWDGDRATATLPDRVTVWLVAALCTQKFYLLFSFLFGYSFTLQERAADRDRASFASRHGRRLLGLFVLGLAHAVLLYPGDILMTYAVLGLALYAVRGLQPRHALCLAGLIAVFLSAVFLTAGVAELTQDAPAASTAAAARDAAALRGDPLSVVSAHIRVYREMFSGAVLYSGHLFAAFLAGQAAGRRRLLGRSGTAAARAHARMKRLLAVGLLLGLPGGVFTVMCTHGPLAGRFYYIGLGVGILTAPALAAAYACALLMLLRGRLGARLGAALAPAGRMSLSHYLFQSLALAFVFTGYGLALYGRIGPAVLALGCVVLYTGQLAFGAWLMSRTRYGPAELLLRRITLGRRVPRTSPHA